MLFSIQDIQYLSLLDLMAFTLIYGTQYVVFGLLEWEEGGSQIDFFGLNQIEMSLFNLILLVLAFVVIAPIVGFLKGKIGLIPAMLIAPLAFGLLHPGHQLSTTIMGLVFNGLYLTKKSLAFPILLHMIWSAFASDDLLIHVIFG